MLNLYLHPKARLVLLSCGCYPLCVMGRHSASSLRKTRVTADNQTLHSGPESSAATQSFFGQEGHCLDTDTPTTEMVMSSRHT